MVQVGFRAGFERVVVVAEDGPGEHAVRVPCAGEGGVEAGEERPGAPAEDVEEGRGHGGVPGGWRALVEDYEGGGVRAGELRGEEGAGDVEDALFVGGEISAGGLAGRNGEVEMGKDRVWLSEIGSGADGTWDSRRSL